MNDKLYFVAALSLLLASSCKKAEDSAQPSSSAAGSPAAATSAVPPAPAAPQKPWYEGSWSGSYKAERHVMDVQAGAARGWSKDDGTAAAGEGTLKVSVAPDGTVSGSANGPLGAQSIRGRADEQGLSLELVPQAADAAAFRGVARAERADGALKGELKASSGDSLTVRKAGITLSKQPGG